MLIFFSNFARANPTDSGEFWISGQYTGMRALNAEVRMPSAGGGANPRALGERRDPRVEIRGAPEEMIADGRQRPGPYEATSPAATWQTARV